MPSMPRHSRFSHNHFLSLRFALRCPSADNHAIAPSAGNGRAAILCLRLQGCVFRECMCVCVCVWLCLAKYACKWHKVAAGRAISWIYAACTDGVANLLPKCTAYIGFANHKLKPTA